MQLKKSTDPEVAAFVMSYDVRKQSIGFVARFKIKALQLLQFTEYLSHTYTWVRHYLTLSWDGVVMISTQLADATRGSGKTVVELRNWVEKYQV